MKVFVDTWAWLALAYQRDPYHASAVAEHQKLQGERARYVTTDYVLAETVSPLFSVVPFEKARKFVQEVLDSAAQGRCDLVRVSPEIFNTAWQLRCKFHDKPDISFVDFTSMAVMREVGIVDVFTGDAHFEQVGMGFQLHPKTS